MPKGAKLLAFANPNHRRYFAEFSALDRAAGGPDSHMATVGWLTRDDPPMERLWKIGLYLGVYNVPTAEALWHYFPNPGWVDRRGGVVQQWLADHWSGIATRRERRSVRTPAQLGRFMESLAWWVRRQPEPYWQYVDAYEEGWASVNTIYSVGRYVGIKMLEAAHRYCGFAAAMPDLRAKGGWSPREALALIIPEGASIFLGDDSPANVEAVNLLAELHRATVKAEYDLELDRYEHQVFLCDYKQSYVGQRQYPGRSLDSEIDYWLTVRDHWPDVEFRMFEARLALFPDACLGERRGWNGVRKELGLFLRQTGWTWSDLSFDYPSLDKRA